MLEYQERIYIEIRKGSNVLNIILNYYDTESSKRLGISPFNKSLKRS
jgi:hypothetical protein